MKKIFSYLAILLLSIFLAPQAHAAVGSITLNSLNATDASGSWDPQGNQCFVGNGDFHYKIEVINLSSGNALLGSQDPAPCVDRDTGADWNVSLTSYTPGDTICTLLIHKNENGNDKVKGSSCQATESQNPHLVVFKHVVNDNGGTLTASDFSITAAGQTFNGNELGTDIIIDPGSYTVTEGSHTGYDATYSADCSETIAGGETKTCTITNDDIAPSLTLDKIVVNDNGGQALESAWTLTADGDEAGRLTGPGAPGSADVVSGSDFQTGTYTLSESAGPNGYDAREWSCVKNAGAPVEGGSITLGLADTAICTITNDDIAPQITVIKDVVDINGSFLSYVAYDFTMIIHGAVAPGGDITFHGSEDGITTTDLHTGSYIVIEIGPGGYTTTYSSDCVGALALGDKKECIITNTEKPGRMTGGGSVLTKSGDTPASGVKITHGFELHCNTASLPNNLEINWNDKSGKTQKFHLNTLTSATCELHANPAPPPNTANGFNTFIGAGTGTLNGKSGAIINFTFIDVGEPGKNDTATYNITAPGVVLNTIVPLKLTQGNHQAHLY